ncbi:TetR family transcriptional regulator [Acetobacterium fimetarium]|uniref:TetR family transcriptional regulator n=1 Tax=Acetobacterium fimetarium TaxID=52691 RepID=A0ABR6WUG4_9FIRM|nr:TetR/AcrR family transcriptional regulator [Acetobacterium fimetarium]MBC3804025.1 TetR family transcriptional regulator [Acetobacterium fimetarium]
METKKKIMNSAFRLFAEKGNEFSLTEVANEVGIKKASIYAHFASKEILLYEVIDQEIYEYFFEIDEKRRDLKSTFEMILNYYRRSKTKRYFWKRLLLFPPAAFERTLIKKINMLTEQRYEIIRDLIQSDMENGYIRHQDPETVLYSFLAMIHGLVSITIIYESENLKINQDEIWENFWNGIK